MRILLVEDDEHKMKDIIQYLEVILKGVIIETAHSIESGVQSAIDNQYDLILLDMTIPNFDINETNEGGKSYKNGGEIVVKELLDEDVFFNCAIITQYETFNDEPIDQIGQRVKTYCGDHYYGYVKYSTSDDAWKQSLKILIEHVANTLN